MAPMAEVKKPAPVSDSIQATVHFTLPEKAPSYGHGFVVRFAVAPRVGDRLTVDQQSIRQIPSEDLHQCHWQVVEVRHELNLDQEVAEQNDEYSPLATLYVTVHPAES